MGAEEVAECYEKHASELTRFAASLVGPSDADDVVSAAVIGVLAASTTSVSDLRGYLYRAVLNSARKHWRSSGRRARREAMCGGSELTPEQPELWPEVGQALARLSPQQRAVIHLTYWEDLVPGVVAARLEVSEGTVRRQLARARRRLGEVLDER